MPAPSTATAIRSTRDSKPTSPTSSRSGIAGRYEHYSDFGDTTSGKLSARYAFTDKVALRGTVSTGFRAPSLQQQFFQSIATNFINVNRWRIALPFEIGTFRANDPAAVALGAEPLKAEESKNYSLGLVLQPVDGLYVTVDAYRIDIDDRIALSENLTSATRCATTCRPAAIRASAAAATSPTPSTPRPAAST